MKAACAEAVDLLNQGKSATQVEEHLKAMGLDPEQASMIVRDIVIRNMHPQ
jgi:hypothetical protein